MAEILPQNFPTPTEQSIVTYDFTDVEQGTGVVIYDGYRVQTDGSVITYARRLSRDATYSKGTSTTGTGATTILDVDFDTLPFTIPKVLKGKLNCKFVFATASSGGTGIEGYLVVRVRKWDGSTETEIASSTLGGSGAAYPTNLMFAHASGAAANKNWVMCEVEVPETNFKIGENVRITVEIIKSAGTGTPSAEILHDPTNGTVSFSIGTGSFAPGTDYGSTRFIIEAPYKLQL